MKYDIEIKYTPEFLQELEDRDIEELLYSAQVKFFELREQKSILRRVDRPHLFKKVKKDIARIKTVINEPLLLRR